MHGGENMYFHPMKPALSITEAVSEDAPAIAALRNSAAEDLLKRYGKGHWGTMSTESGVLYNMTNGKILIAKSGSEIIGTLRLATKKPWVINAEYFTPVVRTIYLTDMAVHPDHQHKGVGKAMIEEAKSIAREWPAGSIRLDAYDAPAGAGDFYLKCGFADRGHIIYRTIPHIYFEWLV
jgi:GNAT superfamily N-acetyltransferase